MKEKNETMDQAFENRDGKIVPVEISTEMQQSFLAYAMSVIVSRALPDVRDGLKPVHRRILYTMYEKNLTPDKPYHKCADTVGSVLGSYHPHGDASVYDALVRLAQPFSLRYMLVDGQGNFGSVDGDPPAAYRYTEARMSKIALEMLTDIHKETVPFMPNYDERLQEPVVLPSRYPNLLVNGTTGIAVGMATNIPPHNLAEVVDGIKMLMDNPDCTVEELMTCILGPDFPTGGTIMGKAGIHAAYATGRGKITLRGKTEIERIGQHDAIIITEIPYMVNKARLVESIAALAKEKRVEGIAHIQDESSREGMRIVVELKKDANAEIVLNKLYSFTQLQDTVGVIMLSLVNGEPKILSLKEMLEHYLRFQIEVITNRTRFDLDKAKKRAHILQGFVVAIDYIDEVIQILRTSKTIQEGKQRLMDRFQEVDLSELLDRAEYDMEKYHLEQQIGLSEEQADAIVQMRLGQLTGMERKKVTDELYEITKKISEYLDILADERLVKDIIRKDLEEISRKFSDPRRTMIENVNGEVEIEDLIPVTDCVVTYTNSGYLKRMPVETYKLQKRGGRGVTGMKQREEDFVTEMFISSSHDHIMFLSNRGVMYKIKCYEIPEGGRTAKGMNIVNMITMGEGEYVAAILHAKEFTEGRFVNIVTKKGKIKRTPLEAYRNVRKNGLIAIGLDEGDEIAGVQLTDGSDFLYIATQNGMILKTAEEMIRPMTRSAHGVKAMALREGDSVVAIEREQPGADLLTITTKGFGRRTAPEAYRPQNRGGYGLCNYKTSEEWGTVCGIRMVQPDQDVILISSDGVIIRVSVEDFRQMGRMAKGVRAMRVTGENQVVTFTSAEHDASAELVKPEEMPDSDLPQEESPELLALEELQDADAAAENPEA